jgi:hypothetical protein
MTLGKAEVKEMLDTERKKAAHFISERKAHWKHNLETWEAHRTTLREKLVSLDKLLSKDLPTEKAPFEEQKKETLQAIYEVEAAIRKTWDDVGFRFHARLDELKENLDGYRLPLALAGPEKANELTKGKLELQTAIQNVVTKLEKESRAGEKLDMFGEEMSASFEHMKKAFSELLS